MKLSLGDRLKYWIFGWSSFKYPPTPTLKAKPWHPDGDLQYTALPTQKHPKSKDFILWMESTGRFLINTGSTKPNSQGRVDGYPINLAKSSDREYKISRQLGPYTLSVTTGYSAPYGGTFRFNEKMMVQGNPMEGYSDSKLHIYEPLSDGSVKITEIQNFRYLTKDYLFCDGVKQYTLDQASTDVNGPCAAKLSLIGLNLRYQDVVLQGHKQATWMAINMARHTYIPPAMGSDGYVGGSRKGSVPDNENAPPMGAILRLKESARDRLIEAGYTRTSNPQAHAVLDCYAGPGIIIIDTGGNNSTSLEPDNRWDQKDLAILGQLKMSDFEVWVR